MCQGFSPVIFRNLDVEWAQPDRNLNASHHTVLKHHGGIPDTQDNRYFVKAECKRWTYRTFRWDLERGYYLPDWAQENASLIEARIKYILKECAPIIRRYCDTRNRAYYQWEYEKRRIWNQSGNEIVPDIDLFKAPKAKYEAKLERAFLKMSEQLSHVKGYVPDEMAIMDCPF